MSNDRRPGSLSRRQFVIGAGGIALTGTLSVEPGALADELPRLSEDDPTAVALKYRHDAAAIDASVRATGRLCSNCALYTGSPDSDWGGCGIFPGRRVRAAGWCTAWAPKPGSQ